MKFNREHLEELTLQKIKKVNDEAGYRKYLEVPEMVELVAQSIEEMLPAMVREWVERAKQAEGELSELRDRHADTLNTLM